MFLPWQCDCFPRAVWNGFTRGIDGEEHSRQKLSAGHERRAVTLLDLMCRSSSYIMCLDHLESLDLGVQLCCSETTMLQ